MSVTTATIWVCAKCGAVSHVDGGAQPSWVPGRFCPGRIESERQLGHQIKPVLVVVPYA